MTEYSVLIAIYRGVCCLYAGVRVLSLCRSAYLVTEYSVLIAIYQGILTVYVVINFGLATFMDPGVYPKGNLSSFCVRL